MKASFVFITFCLCLFAVESFGASPVGKTHRAQDYSQDCGNGRRGVKCTDFASLNFSYLAPTLREDGSTLTLNEISHYAVQYEKDGGLTIQFFVPKTTNFTLPKMPSGSYVFRIATVDTTGQQGAFGADFPITIP